jgi:hypothetical protein
MEIKNSICDKCGKTAYEGLAGELDILILKSGKPLYSLYDERDVPYDSKTEITLCLLCRSYLSNIIFDFVNNKDNK